MLPPSGSEPEERERGLSESQCGPLLPIETHLVPNGLHTTRPAVVSSVLQRCQNRRGGEVYHQLLHCGPPGISCCPAEAQQQSD